MLVSRVLAILAVIAAVVSFRDGVMMARDWSLADVLPYLAAFPLFYVVLVAVLRAR